MALERVTGDDLMRQMSDEYTAFFRNEYQAVVRTVELMVGDHEAALDIAQEAFARLYRHWKKISRYERPDAYVRRIAINLAISHLRRRSVQARALALLLPETEHQTAPDDVVLTAVRRLPAAQRAATVLFYFEDQPSSEIARILDCAESTVRVHLHKARSKLAQMLAEIDEGARSFDVAR